MKKDISLSAKTRIVVCILCLAGLHSAAQADAIDSMLMSPVPDYEQNAITLIPDYFGRGAVDSATLVLNTWRHDCRTTWKDDRIVILMSIVNRSYNDSLLDQHFFRNADYFQNCYTESQGNVVSEYNGYLSPSRIAYNKFSVKLADSLSRAVDRASTEYLLCLYYSGKFDDFYRLLKADRAFSQSKLKALYDAEIDDLLRINQQHLAVYSGAWIHLGKSKLLGAHPSVGLTYGKKYRKFTGDAFLAFRFLDTPDKYYIRQNTVMDSSNGYGGLHLGFDFGYELYRSPKHELDLYTGVGYETINTDISRSNSNGFIYIDALNINPGIEYRRYYGETWVRYFGLKVRYNIIDYNSKAMLASDLSGNAISVEIIWGLSGEYARNQGLKALRYQ